MRAYEILAEWGRIVRGVNTTADVDVGEIRKQAAKFGNDVSDDGVPALSLSDSAKRLAGR